MKILYGINTNGQGHINRSSVFISELIADGNDVHVFLSGKKPPKYAFDIAEKVFYRPGPIDIYKDNRVLIAKSFVFNMQQLSEYAKVRKEINDLDKKENFDVIFSDFERISSVAGRDLNKPVICIDRQHALYHPEISFIPFRPLGKMAFRAAVGILAPYTTKCYALDFTNAIRPGDDITLVPLIWKPELSNYKTSTKDHIVVYFGRFDQLELIDILSSFKHETFYVYGFNEEKQIGNIFFKKTSRDGFLKDLASSKAVIGTAGFNLIWEVCLLNKLMWTIPHSNSFEQITNAYALEQLNLGYVSRNLTKKDLEAFLEWLDNQQLKPSVNLTVLHASEFLEHVYDYIEEYQDQRINSPGQIRRAIKNDSSWWRKRKEIKKEIKLEVET